jgi:amino-acid N-acetyltransferase
MDRTAIAARPPLAVAIALLRAADLPSEDLTDSHLEHFFMAGVPESGVGLVGLELFGRHALLRSLVVDRQVRSTGLGSRLLEHAEAHARAHGAESIYLLTTTAESFFGNRGYARTERSTAPESIRGTREFASLCPASAAFMVKHLSA